MRIHPAVFFCWMLAAMTCPAPIYNTDNYLLIANQFNNGSNTLDDIIGNQLPIGATASTWNCCNESPTNNNNTCYSTYLYDPNDPDGLGPGAPLWYESDDATPAKITVPPGHGLFIHYVGQPNILALHGTPNIPVLPAVLPCGFGHYNLLGRQTNDVGTYENVTGYTPQEGSQVLRWNSGLTNFTTYTFSSGAWSPSTPVLNVGEAAFFLVPPNIAYSATAHMVTITWSCSAVLQQANQPNGPWTNVSSGGVSPCTLPIDAQARFYRLQSN